MVKRLINKRQYIFDIEKKIVILHLDKCLQRFSIEKNFITKRKNLDIENVEIFNLPIGLSVTCIQLGYSVIVTDGENFKQLIKQFEINEILELLQKMLEKKQQIKEFYKWK